MSAMKQSEVLLVVEDDPELREAIVESLQELNCLLYAFGNAEDALLFAKEKKCFAIISDFRMPGMNGVEFCKRIKRERADCRFVLLAGFADKQTAIEGLRFGVDDILEKPQDLSRLRDIAENYLIDRIALLEKEKNDTLAFRSEFSKKIQKSVDDIEANVLLLKDSKFKPNIVQELTQSTHEIVDVTQTLSGAESIHQVALAFERLLKSIQGQGNVYPHGVIQVLVQGTDVIKTLVSEFAQVRARVVNLRPVIDALARWTDNATDDDAINEHDSALETESTGELFTAEPEFLGVDESVIAGYLHQFKLNEAALARYTAHTAADYKSAHLVVTDESLNTVRDLVGDLLVLKSAYNSTMTKLSMDGIGDSQKQQIEEMAQSLNLISERIEDQVLEMRKIPLKDVFYHFPEMVKKMSLDSGKAVSLEMSGLDFGVDKSVADAIASMTTRLIWSALNFGIESVDTRIDRNKSVSGDIRVHAELAAGMITISVGDDGYGVDPEQLKKRALDLGLVSKDEAYVMTTAEAMKLLFVPAISRRKALTDDAGVVYGLERLRVDVEAYDGRCSIESTFGLGTRITIEIPEARAVQTENSLLADSGGCSLIVPMSNIAHITPMKELILSRVDGRMTCQYEGVTIPLGDFRQFTGDRVTTTAFEKSDFPAESIVLVISDDTHSVALVVDRVIDQISAVVQPFDNVIDRLTGFRGTTLLDAEKIAFVVDPESLLGAAYAA